MPGVHCSGLSLAAVNRGLLSSCGVHASRWGGFCRQAQASGGAALSLRAPSLHNLWAPPRPGIKPASPALAGRFSATGPPGKPSLVLDRSLWDLGEASKEEHLMGSYHHLAWSAEHFENHLIYGEATQGLNQGGGGFLPKTVCGAGGEEDVMEETEKEHPREGRSGSCSKKEGMCFLRRYGRVL